MPVINSLEWTFDTNAVNYARLRPGYCDEIYKDIFDFIPINENSSALEIGIGGGQATRPILDTGCGVAAVEYGRNFVDLCREKFKAYPCFSAVNERFEDFEAADEAYDLIFSASAFHWIPEQIGYPKVCRLLKKGGAFAGFANHPYKDKGRENLHLALQEVYAVYMPGSKSGEEYGEAEAKQRARIAEKYGFEDVSYKLYHRVRTFTAVEYTALLGTYSDHIAIEESKRKCFFREIEEVINSFGGRIDVYDTMDLQLARKK